MSVVVNVKGGTGAGRRRPKKLDAWRCRCRSSEHGPKVHPGDRYSCGVCGLRRHDGDPA